MGDVLEVGPARPEEYAQAFRLIFAHVREEDREPRVANALGLLERREFDANGLFVARRAGLQGAMICLAVPGAAGLVWPPGVTDVPDRAWIEDRLVGRACTWLRERGSKMAQSLLTVGDLPLAPPLERDGFARITTLWFLRHDLTPPWPVFSPCLEVRTYEDVPGELFRETLMRTYEGTLDCPEVNGVREANEIIEGHQAQGVHDPGRWLLAFDRGQPVGVLLLTELSDWEGWDLSYLGVVPEARRRGVGRELALRAIQLARQAGAAQLTLSVDTRNRPAWDLYTRLGFEPFDERTVYLAVWNQPADGEQLQPH